MDFTKLSESKNFRTVLLIIIIVVLALLIFQAGQAVGYRKAMFSNHLGENYYRAFGPRNIDMYGMMGRDGMPGGHGAVGKIVKVNLPSVVIEGPDNIEKEIIIEGQTLIRNADQAGTSTDLKTDDFVTVIGTPNENGQIQAKLIRVLPPRE